MATIHKRRLGSGETVWDLTHGTGPARQRFIAGKTKEEAENTVRDNKRRRSSGEIKEEAVPEEIEREQKLRLALATRVGRMDQRENAKYGWLGRRSVRPKVSTLTVNYELLVLSTFLRRSIKRNHLLLNPSDPVERFRIPKRALPKFMTSDELSKFFKACTPAERRRFMTILLTGMRKGEVEHLIWEDISYELGVISIREKPEIGWKPKTDERLIPISPVLNDVLVEQLSHRTSTLWVFANESGNRDTHILGS